MDQEFKSVWVARLEKLELGHVMEAWLHAQWIKNLSVLTSSAVGVGGWGLMGNM